VRALRLQNVDEAAPLIDLLLDALDGFEIHAGAPIDATLRRDLLRRRVHCLRLRGRWNEARELIEVLLADDHNPRRAMLLADLGLIAANHRALDNVVLPNDPAERGSYAQVLERGEEDFRRSAEAGGAGGHGEYCLGVLDLARERPGDALPYLRRAVAEMSSRSDVYERLYILPRARLYLAYALSTTEERGRMQTAVEELERGLTALPNEVPDLVKKTIETLALLAPRATQALFTRTGDMLGQDALDLACELDFLRNMPDLVLRVRERADNESRTAEQRWSDYDALLSTALALGDADAARDALDGLELLSDRLPDRFLALLDDPARIATLWELDEVAFSRARVLVGTGRFDDAARSLQDAAYLALRDEPADGRRQALQIVDLIRTWGVEPDDGLLQRLGEPDEEDEPVLAESEARGVVMFIGGNQQQERYREDIQRELREKYPKIQLVMRHPNWGSNWGRWLKKHDGELNNCDTLVVMRFVRTNLGRRLRKLASGRGIRWWPCTGHGRASILHSIESAIAGLQQSG
ncbi:MAG: hypothetical protein ACYTGZ_22240, partial [Planctomycetota bacterium]